MNKKLLLGAIAAVFAFGLVGCTPEAREDYDSAGDAAQQSMEKTGEAVAADAEVAGEAAQDAVADSAEAAAAAEMTLKVKNAILTAENLEAEDLNVDTKDKTIYLKGRVPTNEEKTRAEQIAKTQAGSEYNVVNELTVGAD